MSIPYREGPGGLSDLKEMDMYGTASKAPIGTTGRTGERCPESGVWEVAGTPTTTAPIAKNNVFPPYGGRAVTWRLVRYA